jgi:hypothetical protein
MREMKDGELSAPIDKDFLGVPGIDERVETKARAELAELDRVEILALRHLVGRAAVGSN